MACVQDTASINLSVVAGQLSADVIVDPGTGMAPNLLVVNPTGVYVIGSDGWVPIPATLAFSSADGHTFVATTSADLRAFVGLGDKIRLVQSGVPGYYVVTAIAAGTITLYGGTLSTLAASAISLPYFSKAHSPIGFSMNPESWTEELVDSTQVIQVASTPGTWYNPGSLFLDVPIGAWELGYCASPQNSFGGAAQALDILTALSTANNSGSDVKLIGWLRGSAIVVLGGTVARQRDVAVTVKTRYFLNIRSAQTTNISYEGSAGGPSIIRATCAYIGS